MPMSKPILTPVSMPIKQNRGPGQGQAAHVESLSHNILSVLMLQLLDNAKPGDMEQR